MWRAIRYGLSGEPARPRHATRSGPRARSSSGSSSGSARSPTSSALPLAIPAANAAERQIARIEEGWTLEEIYAEQVKLARADVGAR